MEINVQPYAYVRPVGGSRLRFAFLAQEERRILLTVCIKVHLKPSKYIFVKIFSRLRHSLVVN